MSQRPQNACNGQGENPAWTRQRLAKLFEAERRLCAESSRQREAAQSARRRLREAVGASRRLTAGYTSLLVPGRGTKRPIR